MQHHFNEFRDDERLQTQSLIVAETQHVPRLRRERESFEVIYAKAKQLGFDDRNTYTNTNDDYQTLTTCLLSLILLF